MAKNKRAHAHRLWIGRFSEMGRIYLVTTTTYRRIPLFHDLFLGRLVVAPLRREQDSTETLCFVIMPDHLHWLVQVKEGSDLPSIIQRVKSVSAHAIRHRLGTRGPVWLDGYHDRALRREDKVKTVARYVVANPLRAGLVERLGDYPLWDAVGI